MQNLLSWYLYIVLYDLVTESLRESPLWDQRLHWIALGNLAPDFVFEDYSWGLFTGRDDCQAVDNWNMDSAELAQSWVLPKTADQNYLYLQRQKRTMNKTLIFFNIILLAFTTLIPLSFQLVKAPLKLFFDIMWSCTIIFLLMSCMSSYLSIESKKVKMSKGVWWVWWVQHLHNSVFCKHLRIKRFWVCWWKRMQNW